MKTKSQYTLLLLTFSLNSFCQSGLLGSYPFNGNAMDASTNGNNGLVNNAVLTSDRFGNSNSAYLFNGLNSYINLGNNFSYNSHSFSCWARRDSVSGNTLISKVYNGIHDLKNSEFSINVFTIGNGTNWLSVNSTASPNYAQWNCYVATYDSNTNEGKLYVNGVADSTTLGNYFHVNNTPVFIGARPYWSGNSGPAFFFKGAIDDVNIYNRVLTQKEVDSLCSNLTAVKSYSNLIELRISPNPFSNQAVLWIDRPLINVDLTIENYLGQTVKRISNINTTTVILNRNDLPSGLYFIRLIDNNVTIITKKIIIADN